MTTDTFEKERLLPHRLPLVRVLVAIGGIYLAQSLVGGITFHGVPAVLRERGIALDKIGLVSLAMLPWALKFLWAPSIERYRLHGREGRRSRRIVLLGELCAAASLMALAFIGPSPTLWLFTALAMVALFSATVDIAADAFAVEQLSEENRGWGNTAQVGGAYLGGVLGAGLFLILVPTAGWETACLLSAGTIVLFALPFVFGPEPVTAPVDSAHKPSLRYAFGRSEVRIGILMTLLFEAGVRLASGMGGPFLIDRGVSLEMLGLINGVGGVATGVAGTALGGLLVRVSGAGPAVILAAVGQAVALSLYAVAAFLPEAPVSVLIGISLLKVFAMAVGFVTLYALLMGLSSLRQAGVDFTLFQCADATMAALAGYGGGMLASIFGYGLCFAIAASLGLAAVFALPALLKQLPYMSGTVR